MRSLRLLGAVTAAGILIVAGCGDDATEPAAPATTTEASGTGAEPGAPAAGEPDYEGLGTWWRKLPDDERVDSAAEFIADHRAECEDVRPVDLERQTGIAFGYDFPEATPTSAVMLETCALIRDGT